MSIMSTRHSARIFGRSIPLPKSKPARIGLGALFLSGGLLGFLPVVGYWMVPVGIVILSVDIPPVRRFRRRMEVRLVPVWRRLAARWREWRTGRQA